MSQVNFSKIKNLMGKLSLYPFREQSQVLLLLCLTSDRVSRVCSQAQDFLDDLREDQSMPETGCGLTESEGQPDFVLKTKEQVRIW